MESRSHKRAENPMAPWWQRLGWLILIWSASVAVLALVAWLLKLLMRSVGMTA